MNNFHNPSSKHACDYSSAYAAIYDSSYGAGFVFVDEDEYCSDDNTSTSIPSAPILARLKRRENGRTVLKVIIAKA